jgi:hypothetical protein
VGADWRSLEIWLAGCGPRIICNSCLIQTDINNDWHIVCGHVQTGPGAQPAFCTIGTGYFPGVKQLGRGADHPPPPSAKVENE